MKRVSWTISRLALALGLFVGSFLIPAPSSAYCAFECWPSTWLEFAGVCFPGSAGHLPILHSVLLPTRMSRLSRGIALIALLAASEPRVRAASAICHRVPLKPPSGQAFALAWSLDGRELALTGYLGSTSCCGTVVEGSLLGPRWKSRPWSKGIFSPTEVARERRKAFWSATAATTGSGSIAASSPCAP